MENNEKNKSLDLNGIPEEIQDSLVKYLETIRNPGTSESRTPKYGVLSLIAKDLPKTHNANANDTVTISIKINDEGESVSMKLPKAEFEKEVALSELRHLSLNVAPGNFKKLTADDVGSSISDMRKNSFSGNDNSSNPKNK